MPSQSKRRFAVSRTSSWSSEDGAPCPEAKPGPLKVWDRRTTKSAEEFDERLGLKEPWLSRGTEHGYWYNADGSVGGIQRRLEDRDGWYVEFATLDDLMTFVGKYGDVVVGIEGDQPTIEIYDDYRE